eukprot:scaffold5682_cov22-Phaeocystis_antarctica.AAC.2
MLANPDHGSDHGGMLEVDVSAPAVEEQLAEEHAHHGSQGGEGKGSELHGSGVKGGEANHSPHCGEAKGSEVVWALVEG